MIPQFITRAATLIAAIALVVPLSATENVLLQWNNAALQAVRNTRMAPPVVARALAIVHTCAFDAWAAYNPTAVSTRLSSTPRKAQGGYAQEDKQKAVSFAVYRALLDLFPTQQPLLDAQMATLGYDPADTSTGPSTPSGLGNAAARAVLEFRHHDGSNQLGDLNPGAYTDYTGYQPVNTADTVNDPNRWQPIPIYNGSTFVVPPFLAAHWKLVIPFALTTSSAVRPSAPPLYPDPSYEAQADAVLRLNALLTDRHKMISEFWSDGPSSETPPGHWNLLAQWISQRDRHTLDQDVQLFFVLNNAMLDVSIAVWECKRTYDYARPITAIRFLNQGKRIPAWGGPYNRTRFINGEDWLPYQPATFLTPPFPEYVSGHSTFSAAGAEVLRRFTGSDNFGLLVVLPPGSSRIEPGATPRDEVRLWWPTFSDAADEAGMSRRYGGIHFEKGDLEGRAMGRKIAAIVWDKALSYIRGTSGAP